MVQTMAAGDLGEECDPPCNRHTMAHATRLILPSQTGLSARQQLLSAPAEWTVIVNGRHDDPATAPRLQTRRRRGIAPAYPKISYLGDMRAGTLVAYPGGFVLEPEDKRHPCMNIGRATVVTATFYRDVFEVALSTRECVVVKTGAVEDIDSIFQAYFWNGMA